MYYARTWPEGQHTIDASIAGSLDQTRLFLMFFLYWSWFAENLNLRLGFGRLLGRNSLCGTIDDHAISDKSFDQPVTLNATIIASVNAGLAQVVIAAITDTAVIVLIGNRFATVVAIDAELTGGKVVRGGQSGMAEHDISKTKGPILGHEGLGLHGNVVLLVYLHRCSRRGTSFLAPTIDPLQCLGTEGSA